MMVQDGVKMGCACPLNEHVTNSRNTTDNYMRAHGKEWSDQSLEIPYCVMKIAVTMGD